MRVVPAMEIGGIGPQVKFEVSNHGDVVLAGLTKLRNMEQLFDVVLLVEGERLPAHRVVLASCSEYFRAMFTDGLLETQLDEIQLNGVTAKGMASLIDFAYSSEIVINSDNVEEVLSAANHTQILPVVDACVKYLESQIGLDNCVDMVTMAELFCFHDLKKYINKFMSSNFLSLHMSAELLKLSASQLECLLDLNQPVDCSECDVLSAVICWIVHHYGHSALQASKFLSKINFSDISVEEFRTMQNVSDFDKILSDPVNGEELQPFLGKIHCSTGVIVSGLVNVRGFEECLVVCGGFRAGRGMTNDIHYYDREDGMLKCLTAVPHVEQCNSGLTVVKNKLYVIGGCYNADQLEEVVHCYAFCYDPLAQKWTNIAPMLEERCRFYLGSVGNKIYAIGGDPTASLDTAEFSPCECYNVETNSWSSISPLPGNRMEHAGTVYEDMVYISGGLQDPDGPVFNTFFQYDTEQDRWQQLPSMLSPRADHAMFTYEDKIYTVGGWFEDPNTHQRVMVSTIDCFDLNTRSWETIAHVPHPRLFASYTVHRGQVIVLGGWLGGDYQQKCSHIDKFDLRSRSWVQVTEKVEELWEHASCTMFLPITHYSEL